MKDIKLRALKSTVIVLILFWLYTALIEWKVSFMLDKEYLFGSLIFMIPVYLISLLVIRMRDEVRAKKYKSSINRGYKWVFYLFGWITGIFSPLFWIYQGIMYLRNEEKSFIKNNFNFHKRVYYWGIVVFTLTIIFLLWVFLGLE